MPVKRIEYIAEDRVNPRPLSYGKWKFFEIGGGGFSKKLLQISGNLKLPILNSAYRYRLKRDGGGMHFPNFILSFSAILPSVYIVGRLIISSSETIHMKQRSPFQGFQKLSLELFNFFLGILSLWIWINTSPWILVFSSALFHLHNALRNYPCCMAFKTMKEGQLSRQSLENLSISSQVAENDRCRNANVFIYQIWM